MNRENWLKTGLILALETVMKKNYMVIERDRSINLCKIPENVDRVLAFVLSIVQKSLWEKSLFSRLSHITKYVTDSLGKLCFS